MPRLADRKVRPTWEYRLAAFTENPKAIVAINRVNPKCQREKETSILPFELAENSQEIQSGHLDFEPATIFSCEQSCRLANSRCALRFAR